MRAIIFLLFYFSITTSLLAQSPINARSVALGGVGVTFQDVNSLFTNAAGLVHLANPEVSVNAERRFSMEALSTYTAGFAYPTNSGTFGLLMNYFGFEAYNQQQISMAYARNFAKNLSFSAQIDMHNYRIPEFGSKGILSFQIGVQYELIDNFVVGANIANPIRQEVAEDENLSTVIKLGVAYIASDKLSVHAEAEQDLDFPVRIKVGIDYQIVEVLYARAGIGTNPSMVSFGMGLALDKGLKIDASASYHQVLGLSPGIGIRYEIGNKKSTKKR